MLPVSARMDPFSALFGAVAILLAALTAHQSAQINALRREVRSLRDELERYEALTKRLEALMQEVRK